jgi:hypothetical protein
MATPYLSDLSFIVGKVEEQLIPSVAASEISIPLPASVIVSPINTWATDLPREFVIQDGISSERIMVTGITGIFGEYEVTIASVLVNSYVAPRASIMTPGWEQTLVDADFNCRLRAISCIPKIEPDGDSEKFATGDHGRDQSIMGVRVGEISFSEKVAVNQGSGTGAMCTITVVAGVITAVTATPPSGHEGTGYKANDLLTVSNSAGVKGQVRVSTVSTGGVITAFETTPVNGGSGYVGGTGLTIEVTADAGALTAITATPTAAGTDYEVGDIVLVAGGTAGKATVTTISTGGVVTAMNTTPTVAGTGYTSGAGKATSLSGRIHNSTVGAIDIPLWGKFLRGLGHSEEVYAGTGIGYKDEASADDVNMTLYYFIIQGGAAPAAQCYVFKGCKGTGDIGASGIGKDWMLNGKFTGTFVRVDAIAAANILALTAPETGRPEVMLSNVIKTTYGATVVPLRCGNWKLDFGGKISPVDNQADSTGREYFMITERDPKFTCDPLIKSIAEEDVFTDVNTEVLKSLSVESSSSSPNISVIIPNSQLLYPGFAVKEGQIAHSRTYRPLRNNLGDGAALAAIPDGCSYEILFGSRT